MSAPEAPHILSGFSRIKAGADIALRGLEHRGELALLELAETRSRFITVAVGIAGAALALLFAGLSATLLIAAIYWDTPDRVSALAWLAGIEIALAAVAVIWARRQWRAWRPLESIREQLRHDVQCLHQIFQDSPN